ncbi:MAG: hypothetical protein HC804_07215 [Anaerolineae bacterium]|nr:hypothetical protein [Anaerolineae bacterium]
MLAKEVSARLMPYNDYLQLLLTESDLSGGGDAPSATQMVEIMGALSALGGTVIVDCGLGLTAVNRPVIEQADHILLCVQPERVGLAAAKQFMAQLQDILFSPIHIHLVLLEFSGSMNVPQQAIESFLGQPVSATITIPAQDLRRAVNKNMPLVQLYPDTKATALINQLAHQLVRD